jgi:hypothetical protein
VNSHLRALRDGGYLVHILVDEDMERAELSLYSMADEFASDAIERIVVGSSGLPWATFKEVYQDAVFGSEVDAALGSFACSAFGKGYLLARDERQSLADPMVTNTGTAPPDKFKTL